MFSNFIKLAFRNFIKSPLIAFIELFGMTIGLTVFLLLMLWVYNELSYDTFNEQKDSIYRLEVKDERDENSALHASIVTPLLKDNLPEITKASRLRWFNPNHKVEF